MFNKASNDRGQVEGATTQDYDALVGIWPRPKSQNLRESLATYHNRIDACHEFVVAVGYFYTSRRLSPGSVGYDISRRNKGRGVLPLDE